MIHRYISVTERWTDGHTDKTETVASFTLENAPKRGK